MSDTVEHNIVNDTSKNDTEVINQLSQDCTRDHRVCKSVDAAILKCFDQNNILSVKVLDEFIKFITKYRYSYYSKNTKCISQLPNIQQSLTTLFALYPPSTASIQLLINDDAEDILKLLLSYDHILNPSLLSFAITSAELKCANLLSKYNNLDVSTKHLNEAISKNMVDVFDNIINRKIQPLPSSLTSAIRVMNYNMITTIITLGITPTDKNLEEACSTQSKEMIKYFLDLKLSPTKTCLKNLIKGNEDRYGYRHTKYDQRRREEKAVPITTLIDMLINYGYRPTYEDVLSATKNHIKINSIYYITKF